MKDELQTAVETLGLEKFRRHIFLCVDADEPKCCPRETSLAAWEFLKNRLKELQLNSALGVIVLAIRGTNGQMVFNPPAETVLAEGDYLIAMGAVPNLQKLETLVALTGSQRW